MNDTATPPEFAEPTHVTEATINEISKSLPRLVGRMLKLCLIIEYGSLTLRLPDGGGVYRIEGGRPGPDAYIDIHDYRFARRAVSDGDMGAAESFLRGEWDSPDVTTFLELFCVNQEIIADTLTRNWLLSTGRRMFHWLNRNTRSGSRRNISAHYDLGNDFYSAWLDRTMTYSSAIFDGAKELAEAQLNKYRSLTERLAIGPDHKVLEIGCGWGGFAEFAASQVGCKVTGITISQEQHDYAAKRIFDAGLSERVDIVMRDYREETGIYDRIASIEMIEAVGEDYWPVYFGALSDRLGEDGKAGIQAITIRDDYFDDYRRDPDFIQRYVFPGGMLPSHAVLASMGKRFGIPLQSERIFGLDYARTLAEWRERFLAAWPKLATYGFDAQFQRLWRYYLHYCEAGFRAGNIDVRQMVFAKA